MIKSDSYHVELCLNVVREDARLKSECCFLGSHVSIPICFRTDFLQHQQDSSSDYNIHVKIWECFTSFTSPIRVLEVRCFAGFDIDLGRKQPLLLHCLWIKDTSLKCLAANTWCRVSNHTHGFRVTPLFFNFNPKCCCFPRYAMNNVLDWMTVSIYRTSARS